MFEAAKHALVNVDLKVAIAKKLEIFGVSLDDFGQPPVCFGGVIVGSILRDSLETEPGTASKEQKKSMETCNSLDSHSKSSHRFILHQNMSKC